MMIIVSMGVYNWVIGYRSTYLGEGDINVYLFTDCADKWDVISRISNIALQHNENYKQ